MMRWARAGPGRVAGGRHVLPHTRCSPRTSPSLPPPMLAWSGVGGLGVTEDETPALSSSAHEGLSGTILPGRGALHTLPSLPQQRNL